MLLPFFVLLAALAVIALGGAEMLALDTKATGAARMSRYESVAVRSAEQHLTGSLGHIEQIFAQAHLGHAVLTPPLAMGPTSLCDAAAPCGYSATATYAFDGTTELAPDPAAGDTVTAQNVETADRVAERRFAVTITLSIQDARGVTVVVRPHRKMVRVWAQAPYAELLGDQDSGARANRSATGSADMGGCDAAAATGCDPKAVSALDSTALHGTIPCNDTSSSDPARDNYGSGACVPNSARTPSAPTQTAIPYNNAQMLSAARAP